MASSPTFARVHVMVVCEDINFHDDESVDLLGVRTEILAPSFPHTQPILAVYAQVAGKFGAVSGKVQVTHPDIEEPLHSTLPLEIDLAGPLQPIPAVWWIEYCSFPQPGLYYVQLLLDDKLSSERLLILSENEATNGY